MNSPDTQINHFRYLMRCQMAAMEQQECLLQNEWYIKRKHRQAELLQEWELSKEVETQIDTLHKALVAYLKKMKEATNPISRWWIRQQFQRAKVNERLMYYERVERMQAAQAVSGQFNKLKPPTVPGQYELSRKPRPQYQKIMQPILAPLQPKRGLSMWGKEIFISVKKFFGARLSPDELTIDVEQALRRYSIQAFAALTAHRQPNIETDPAAINQFYEKAAAQYFASVCARAKQQYSIPHFILAHLNSAYTNWQEQHKQTWQTLLRTEEQYDNLASFKVVIARLRAEFQGCVQKPELGNSEKFNAVQACFMAIRLELQVLLLNQLVRRDAHPELNRLTVAACKESMEELRTAYSESLKAILVPGPHEASRLRLPEKLTVPKDITNEEIKKWLFYCLTGQMKTLLGMSGGEEPSLEMLRGGCSALSSIIYFAEQLKLWPVAKLLDERDEYDLGQAKEFLASQEPLEDEQLKLWPVVKLLDERDEYDLGQAKEFLAPQEPLENEEYIWINQLGIKKTEYQIAVIKLKSLVVESIGRFRQGHKAKELPPFPEYYAWLQQDESYIAKERATHQLYKEFSRIYHPDKFPEGDYYRQYNKEMSEISNIKRALYEYLKPDSIEKPPNNEKNHLVIDYYTYGIRADEHAIKWENFKVRLHKLEDDRSSWQERYNEARAKIQMEERLVAERTEREQERAEKERYRAERKQERAKKEQARAEKEQERAEKEQARAEKEQARAEKEQAQAQVAALQKAILEMQAGMQVARARASFPAAKPVPAESTLNLDKEEEEDYETASDDESLTRPPLLI